MKNVLIINGGKAFGESGGKLNDTLTHIAKEQLETLGMNVKITIADSHYNPQDEVKKYLWADLIIYQMPGWWMGEPWIMKKYIDEVFSQGHGVLYENDGRSRFDESKKYGSGGLIQGKKYMLSLTWNAPLEAFTDPDQFFHGTGVDNVYLHFHKANEFLGMTALPTFIVNDVVKTTDVPAYIASYQKHLNAIISQ